MVEPFLPAFFVSPFLILCYPLFVKDGEFRYDEMKRREFRANINGTILSQFTSPRYLRRNSSLFAYLLQMIVHCSSFYCLQGKLCRESRISQCENSLLYEGIFPFFMSRLIVATMQKGTYIFLFSLLTKLYILV